jgi:transcriptional regulator with XRE-family HTH domain
MSLKYARGYPEWPSRSIDRPRATGLPGASNNQLCLSSDGGFPGSASQGHVVGGTRMADRLSQPGDDPDPGRVATQQDFGRELTLARQRAGLTVREVARAAGLPPSTAGDYFSGRHLPPPNQPGLLPAILRACGETDPERLRAWMAALSIARRTPRRRAAGATPPYLGLASFQQDDAPLFFGREEITGRLVALATATGAGRPGARAGDPAAAADGGPMAGDAAGPGTEGVPLAVVGPSGSGKSSLLRAGLVPRLLAGPVPDPQPPGPGLAPEQQQQAGRRPVALFTPSGSPLAELAAQLSGLIAGEGLTPGGLIAGEGLAAGELAAMLGRDPARAGQPPAVAVPRRASGRYPARLPPAVAVPRRASGRRQRPHPAHRAQGGRSGRTAAIVRGCPTYADVIASGATCAKD